MRLGITLSVAAVIVFHQWRGIEGRKKIGLKGIWNAGPDMEALDDFPRQNENCYGSHKGDFRIKNSHKHDNIHGLQNDVVDKRSHEIGELQGLQQVISKDSIDSISKELNPFSSLLDIEDNIFKGGPLKNFSRKDEHRPHLRICNLKKNDKWDKENAEEDDEEDDYDEEDEDFGREGKAASPIEVFGKVLSKGTGVFSQDGLLGQVANMLGLASEKEHKKHSKYQGKLANFIYHDDDNGTIGVNKGKSDGFSQRGKFWDEENEIGNKTLNPEFKEERDENATRNGGVWYENLLKKHQDWWKKLTKLQPDSMVSFPYSYIEISKPHYHHTENGSINALIRKLNEGAGGSSLPIEMALLGKILELGENYNTSLKETADESDSEGLDEMIKRLSNDGWTPNSKGTAEESKGGGILSLLSSKIGHSLLPSLIPIPEHSPLFPFNLGLGISSAERRGKSEEEEEEEDVVTRKEEWAKWRSRERNREEEESGDSWIEKRKNEEGMLERDNNGLEAIDMIPRKIEKWLKNGIRKGGSDCDGSQIMLGNPLGHVKLLEQKMKKLDSLHKDNLHHNMEEEIWTAEKLKNAENGKTNGLTPKANDMVHDSFTKSTKKKPHKLIDDGVRESMKMHGGKEAASLFPNGSDETSFHGMAGMLADGIGAVMSKSKDWFGKKLKPNSTSASSTSMDSLVTESINQTFLEGSQSEISILQGGDIPINSSFLADKQVSNATSLKSCLNSSSSQPGTAPKSWFPWRSSPTSTTSSSASEGPTAFLSPSPSAESNKSTPSPRKGTGRTTRKPKEMKEPTGDKEGVTHANKNFTHGENVENKEGKVVKPLKANIQGDKKIAEGTLNMTTTEVSHEIETKKDLIDLDIVEKKLGDKEMKNELKTKGIKNSIMESAGKLNQGNVTGEPLSQNEEKFLKGTQSPIGSRVEVSRKEGGSTKIRNEKKPVKSFLMGFLQNAISTTQSVQQSTNNNENNKLTDEKEECKGSGVFEETLKNVKEKVCEQLTDTFGRVTSSVEKVDECLVRIGETVKESNRLIGSIEKPKMNWKPLEELSRTLTSERTCLSDKEDAGERVGNKENEKSVGRINMIAQICKNKDETALSNRVLNWFERVPNFWGRKPSESNRRDDKNLSSKENNLLTDHKTSSLSDLLSPTEHFQNPRKKSEWLGSLGMQAEEPLEMSNLHKQPNIEEMDELSTMPKIDEATWDPIGPHSRNGIEFFEEIALISTNPNLELAIDSGKTSDKVSTQSIKQKNIFDGVEQKYLNESNDANFNTESHILNNHLSDAHLPKQQRANLLQNIESNSSERIASLNPNKPEVIKRLESGLPSEVTAPSNTLNSFKKMSSSGALKNVPEINSFDFTTNKLTIPNKCLSISSTDPIAFASSSPASLELYYNTHKTNHNNLLDPRARKLEEMSSNLEENKKALYDLDREFMYLVKKMLNLLRDSAKPPLSPSEMDESEMDLDGNRREESSVPNKKSPTGSVMKLEVPLQRLVLMSKKENKFNSFPQNAQIDEMKLNSLKGSAGEGYSVGRSAEIELGESYLLKPNEFESKKNNGNKLKITKSGKKDVRENPSGDLSLMIINQNGDQPDGQKKSGLSSDFAGNPIGKEGKTMKATGLKKVVLLEANGKGEGERKYAIREDLKGKDNDLKGPSNRKCSMKMESNLNECESETQAGIRGKEDGMQCGGIDKGDKLINSIEESLELESGGNVVNLFANLSKHNFENKSRFSKNPKEIKMKGGLKESSGHQQERISCKKDSRSALKGKKKKAFCKLMSSPFQWMDRGRGRVRPAKYRERGQGILNGEGLKEFKNNKGDEGIKTSLRMSFEPDLEQSIRGFNRKNSGWANADVDPEHDKREFIPIREKDTSGFENGYPETKRDLEKNIRLIGLLNPSLLDKNIDTFLHGSNENLDGEERGKKYEKKIDIPMGPSGFESGDLGIIGKNGVIYPLSMEGDVQEGFGRGLRSYDERDDSLSSHDEKVLSPLLMDLERFADKFIRKKRGCLQNKKTVGAFHKREGFLNHEE